MGYRQVVRSLSDQISEIETPAGSLYRKSRRQAYLCCPHCEMNTSMAVGSRQELQGLTQKFTDGTERGLTLFTIQLTCDYCSGNCLFLWEVVNPIGVNSGAHYETVNLTRVYPEPNPKVRHISSDAPPSVREVFKEAALAEVSGAYRLAGVGYRSVVERIAKEKGAVGNSLYSKITSLGEQGVPGNIVDAFHEARVVGNDSVHDGLAYSREEIADIAELIGEAIFVLYVQPAERARMAAARAARRLAVNTSS